jgi:hypothetical protein
MEPTDQEIIDYLLGNLAEPTAVEETLFSGNEFFERLSLMENKLIDLYVLNELTDSERKLFEEKYLISPRRQRTVTNSIQFVSLLDSYRRRYATPQRNWWTRLRSFFNANSFILVPATSLLVVITAAFFWVLVDRTRLRHRTETAEAALRRDQEAQRQASLREQQEREALTREWEDLKRQQAEHQINEETLKRREQELQAAEARLRNNQSDQGGGLVQPSFATFVLSSTSRRINDPRELVIRPQHKFVHLIAYLNDEPAKSYSASIQRAGGGEVWHASLPKPTGDPPQLILVVPSSVFKQKDYIVKFEALPRSEQSAPIEYGLAVRRIRR